MVFCDGFHYLDMPNGIIDSLLWIISTVNYCEFTGNELMALEIVLNRNLVNPEHLEKKSFDKQLTDEMLKIIGAR